MDKGHNRCRAFSGRGQVTKGPVGDHSKGGKRKTKPNNTGISGELLIRGPRPGFEACGDCQLDPILRHTARENSLPQRKPLSLLKSGTSRDSGGGSRNPYIDVREVPECSGNGLRREEAGRRKSLREHIKKYRLTGGKGKMAAETASQAVRQNQYNAFTRFHAIHLSLGTQAPLNFPVFLVI